MSAKISSVLATFSSVLVENYVYCNSPTQIFPTKTTPLVALILFHSFTTIYMCWWTEMGVGWMYGVALSSTSATQIYEVNVQSHNDEI